MTQKEVIIIGRINKGELPIGGETGKNQALVSGLSKYCKVYELDFYKNKQRPWIFLQAIWTIFTHPHATLILSSTASNVYLLMKIHKFISSKRNVIHWVIGGKFANYVQDGRYSPEILNKLRANIVESRAMNEMLYSCGVTNSEYVPNFKVIPYLPDINKRIALLKAATKVRFVYLSRVMKVKGVDLILEASRKISQMEFNDKFEVDFYGLIEKGYESEFLGKVDSLNNVNYKGMLNLQQNKGYDTLASYHMMLFPTYHSSEGFAGVFIDSFIAGLPVITTPWHVNPEIIDDKENGLFVEPKNVESLVETMLEVIEGKVDLEKMSRASQKYTNRYNVEKVLNKQLLSRLNIL